jgi:hypothetical protein
MKTFPPAAPVVWEVGYRIGKVLRHAEEKEQREPSTNSDGTHARPRAHVRKAHWHTYWTGPKKDPQTAKLKWLHPMVINDDGEDLIPTVHLVL